MNKTVMSTDMEDDLQVLEVGSFRDLSSKNNPNNYLIEYQPPIKMLFEQFEKIKGVPPSESQKEAIRLDANAIVLPVGIHD